MVGCAWFEEVKGHDAAGRYDDDVVVRVDTDAGQINMNQTCKNLL